MGTFGISGALAAAGGSGLAFIIISSILLLLFALFSYKIYRASLYIVGAIGLGVPGYAYVAPIVSDVISVSGFWVDILVAVACGLIGIAIVLALQKMAIFFVGAAIGFILGGTVSSMLTELTGMDFFSTVPGTIIVPIVVAILLGMLAKAMFKPIFVFGTAILSTIGAAEMVAVKINPDFLLAGTVIGVIIGILCAMFQLKSNKK